MNKLSMNNLSMKQIRLIILADSSENSSEIKKTNLLIKKFYFFEFGLNTTCILK